MRGLLLTLMLAGCTAYPKITWPDGAGSGATPALLPQEEITGTVPGTDPGGAVAARAAALKDWAATQAH